MFETQGNKTSLGERERERERKRERERGLIITSTYKSRNIFPENGKQFLTRFDIFSDCDFDIFLCNAWIFTYLRFKFASVWCNLRIYKANDAYIQILRLFEILTKFQVSEKGVHKCTYIHRNTYSAFASQHIGRCLRNSIGTMYSSVNVNFFVGRSTKRWNQSRQKYVTEGPFFWRNSPLDRMAT